MKRVRYITVSTSGVSETSALRATSIICEEIGNGWIIVSAIATGEAVHYIIAEPDQPTPSEEKTEQ